METPLDKNKFASVSRFCLAETVWDLQPPPTRCVPWALNISNTEDASAAGAPTSGHCLQHFPRPSFLPQTTSWIYGAALWWRERERRKGRKHPWNKLLVLALHVIIIIIIRWANNMSENNKVTAQARHKAVEGSIAEEVTLQTCR